MTKKKVKIIGEQMVFTAVLHKEGRWYVAHCEEIGTASEGKTIEDAVKNLKEATELYLETAAELKDTKVEVSRPIITTFTVSNHAKTASGLWA